jgi:DNA-binding MarR family transcriptional regulator
MSFQAQAWARSKTTGSPVKKAVLMAVANYADEHGICWPSQEQLSEDTELSRHSILRALNDLEEAGLLLRAHRYGKNGYRTSDLITLRLSATEQHSTDLSSRELCSTQAAPTLQPATAIIEPPLEPSKKDNSPKAKKRKTYPPLFETFWQAYPTDQNMSKIETFEAWERLPPDDQQLAVSSIPNYRKYLAKNTYMQAIHACRYLKKRRFEGHAKGAPVELVYSRNAPQPSETREEYIRRLAAMSRA